MTRTANLSTWLLRGTYPRLYVPIVLIILLVSGVRYHSLLQAETGEVHRHAAAELRRASDYLLPRLATTPIPDADAITSILRDGITHLGTGVQALRWEPSESAQQPALPATEVHAPAPTAPAAAGGTGPLPAPQPLQHVLAGGGFAPASYRLSLLALLADAGAEGESTAPADGPIGDFMRLPVDVEFGDTLAPVGADEIAAITLGEVRPRTQPSAT